MTKLNGINIEINVANINVQDLKITGYRESVLTVTQEIILPFKDVTSAE
ncbi:MAG: hypothetical protein IPP52_14265 [Ignavibacteria bacterium]|nr:hypothetical protein [Ignavibacteria bacterium]